MSLDTPVCNFPISANPAPGPARTFTIIRVVAIGGSGVAVGNGVSVGGGKVGVVVAVGSSVAVGIGVSVGCCSGAAVGVAVGLA